MPSIVSLEGVVLVAYVTCLVVLLVYSLGQLHLLLIYRRIARTEQTGQRAVAVIALPAVTIQLPVYNEKYVVGRLIEAVSAIDYPADMLEIQVLDDSTDETVAIASELINRLQSTGTSITHVRREQRTGFKAGALAHGLTIARGQLVAIFDADFLPAPDFLRQTVPLFADANVGAVQVRWDHINRPQSHLTQIQAFLLDLHFFLEQPARSRNGLFMNFNGTAGVWRTSAIADAGGWSAATLTEDIDLSYRAQLRGWKLIYLDDYACAGELPAEMSGLRSQQYRWLKGGAQNARRHLAHVVRSGFPRRVRFHGAQHLLAGSVYLAILVALLLSVPLAALKNTSISVDYVDYGIPFATSTLALFAVFHGAQRPAPAGLSGRLRFLGAMVAFLVFTMGLSVHNGGAVLSGWFGRHSEFVRTPKFGTIGWWASAYAGRRVDRRVIPELCVLGALLTGLAIGWHRHEFALVPIQLMASGGLVWVVVLSVVHPIRARRHAPNTVRAAELPTKVP
jgi:cellulose synthase/poly-beta-1,6-N-acetylglucosamine synthase-like glycosyltransferase